MTTNFDIVYDQITDGENGLISEMTPDSVAGSIMKLMDDGVLRDRLIANLSNETNNTAVSEIEKFYSLVN